MGNGSIERIDDFLVQTAADLLLVPRDPLRIISRETGAAGEPFQSENPVELIDQP
jgi:hypothetical protein